MRWLISIYHAAKIRVRPPNGGVQPMEQVVHIDRELIRSARFTDGSFVQDRNICSGETADWFFNLGIPNGLVLWRVRRNTLSRRDGASSLRHHEGVFEANGGNTFLCPARSFASPAHKALTGLFASNLVGRPRWVQGCSFMAGKSCVGGCRMRRPLAYTSRSSGIC